MNTRVEGGIVGNQRPDVPVPSREHLYEAGKLQSIEITGEKHGFSMVCQGINSILASLGRGYENAVAVASVWHNELAFFHSAPDTPLADVIRTMEFAMPGVATQAANCDALRFDVGYNTLTLIDDIARLKSDESDFQKRVSEFLSAEIKKAHPAVRRGTKKFAELMAAYKEKAEGIMRDRDKAEIARLSKEVNVTIRRVLKSLDDSVSAIGKLRQKVEDILALCPASTMASEALGVIEDSSRSLSSKRDYLVSKMQEADGG